MNKKVSALIMAALLLSPLYLVKNQTFATTAEESFTNTYNQYNEKLADYNKARGDYVLARAQYLKFKTQKSETDAFNATLRYLQIRDETVVLYLDVLGKKLDASVGVGSDQNSALKFVLNEEKEWFNQHRENLSSAGTLGDLVTDSNKAGKRFEQDHALFYEILSVVSYGKVFDFQGRTEEIFLALKDKVEDIKSDERDDYKLSFDKNQTLDRWLVESENKIARSEEKQTQAQDVILRFEEKKKKAVPSSTYNRVLSVVTESRQLLKETSTMLLEVIAEIKTK